MALQTPTLNHGDLAAKAQSPKAKPKGIEKDSA